MSFSFFHKAFRQLLTRRPLVVYAATWTVLLLLTVGMASFSAEYAFVSAVSPSSHFSQSCDTRGSIRIPLDVPGEMICLPVCLIKWSRFDVLVPVVFAALLVAASANMIKNVGWWTDDNPSS